MYLKRKLRSCRIHIQAERVCFILKNGKKKFSKFFPMSKLAKKFFFEIFQEFQHFFVKWPKGVLENMERNKVMEYELI